MIDVGSLMVRSVLRGLALSASLALSWAQFFGSSASESSPLELRESYDYCIVGAGPGGLQLGHYLHKQSRDYVIFERQTIPSSFFAHFPRHRHLISLNKRFTGRDNPEFNMRHDWNSLLDTDSEHLFASLSVLLGFPVAHSGGPPLTSVRAPLQPRP